MEEQDTLEIFKESHSEVLSRLNEIFDEGVFELFREKNGNREYFTTYTMNDAIESVIIYKNAIVSGEFINDYEDGVATDISWDSDKVKYIMRIRQKNENVCIIWFDDIVIRDRLYQYHNIGHYWVDGEEYLRQITYRIGLINDKYQVFGDKYCNELELELLPLMEFAPLQSYIYVNWGVKEKFNSTLQGIEAFESLVSCVNDTELLRKLGKYKKRQSGYRQKRIADMLRQDKHQEAVRLLEEKIIKASKGYAMRSFGEMEDELLCKCRDYVYNVQSDRLKKLDIEVLEEQPFTYYEGDFEMKFFFLKRVKFKRDIEQDRWEVKVCYTGNVQEDYNVFVKSVENIFSLGSERYQ
jgi:hypothetical protein